MSVADLIKEFDGRKSVPVDVNDVKDALVARGIRDEIYFWEADIDPTILRGQLVHWDPEKDWEYPTDPMQDVKKRVADIYYAKGLPLAWQRLVSCKELLHILDPTGARTATQEAVTRLTEKIVLPPDLQDATDGYAASTDRVALLQATAILFPWAARELIVANGGLSRAEIAKLVDLPERYVALVMDEQWPAIRDILLTIT
jgi:hypothetical protein